MPDTFVPLSALREMPPVCSPTDTIGWIEWATRYGAFKSADPRGSTAAEASANDPLADPEPQEPHPEPVPTEAAPHLPEVAAPAPRSPASNLKVQPWTAKEDQQLLCLIEVERKTVRQAGDILGRSLRACELRLSRLRRLRAEAASVPAPAPAMPCEPVRPIEKPAPPPVPVAPAPEPLTRATEPATPEPKVEEAAQPAEARAEIAALNGVVPQPPRERPRFKVKDAMTYYAARSRDIFTPRNDYTLMTRLMRGDRVTQIADDCGLPAKVIQDRSRELIPVSLRDRNGNLSIDGAPIALEALRRIVHGEEP